MVANKVVLVQLSTVAMCLVVAGCGSAAIEGKAKSQPDFDHGVSTTTAPPTTTTTSYSTKRWSLLVTGDCIKDLPAAGTTITFLTTIDCGAPHSAEVFASPTLTGETDVDAAAEGACDTAFTAYVGVPVTESEYTYNWLTAVSQSNTSSAKAVCLLYRPDESPIVGSAHS